MSGVRSLTQDEVKAFDVNSTDLRARAMFFLGWGTGMRVSEMLSLQVSDVLTQDNIKERVVTMTKGGERRFFVLPDKTRQEVLTYVQARRPESPQALFLSREGTLSRNQAIRALKSAMKACGIDIGRPGEVATHSLRKTLARDVYASSGKDIVMVQNVLGHKSLTATQHYLQPPRKDVEDTILARKVV